MTGIDPAIENLPIARLEYRRARNPLSKQQHRWSLVVEQNGKDVGNGGEQYGGKAACLEQALKTVGFQPLSLEGAAALAHGATFKRRSDTGSVFPELATVHGHNTHYRILLVGWPKAWVTKSAKH